MRPRQELLVRTGICQRFEPTTSEYPPARCPINFLSIVRATDRGNTTSAGFITLFRVGYDFGERPGAFILGQYALDLYWGDLDQGAPTFSGETMLMAGTRF